MNPAELLARGGVWYNMAGSDPESALAGAVAALASSGRLAEGFDPDGLLHSLVGREAASSTALGGGIAFPHPREPLAPSPDSALIALFYPRFPVPWNAADSAPVRAFFLVLSHNPHGHLTALSRLAKACALDGFRALLADEAGERELVAYLSAEPASSLWSPTR